MKENGNASVFSKNTFLGEFNCESACDFSLPDYKRDVKRILFTKAEAIPASVFIDSGEVSYSGIVNYSVVYLDCENRLEGLEFTSEYDGAVKAECEGAHSPSARTRVANFTVRLVGPRKLQAKSTLATGVMLCESERLEIKGDGLDSADTAELSRGEILVGVSKYYSAEEREYAAKICELDGVIADEVRVIHQSANVKIAEASPTDSGVCVKGTIAVGALLQSEGHSPVRAAAEIPFDETVAAEDISEGAEIFADGRLNSLSVEVNPTEFGCDITADAILEISVTAEENSTVSVVHDAYLTSAESECVYESFSYEEKLTGTNERIRLEESVGREELGLARAREILLTDATVKVQTEAASDGELALVGEARFSGVAAEVEESGEMSFVSFKHSSPFEKKIKLSATDYSKVRSTARASVEGAWAQIDKGKVAFGCDVSVTVSAAERKNEKIISSMCVGAPLEEKHTPSKITVYYPESGETLFGIAKKFRTTVREIAVNNSLSESAVASGSTSGIGVRKLIIR